ncbi:GH3 auxin-responsive promoter [Longibacter salinarum]|uniref:GH3 auxin-responsive promoter n=1 Tax=Longibacter salinarum TaxID=1850348 RepID=A0A2A8CYU5_9BACT|nr:GH3 auxin-responsive promoter family protein [Longibacter salinarum]PEN13882.1 GH3 auxin-responsive promoter [Longibacter salinarum]
MNDALRSVLRRLGPLAKVESFKKEPVATQRRLLRSLLKRAADTEWGRSYGFADIADADNVVEAYQERVPLHTYEDIREDATRVRRGAADVMWPGRISNFAVSSGTVSDGKIIPVSQEIIDSNRAFSMGTGFNYLVNTFNIQLLLGKHLTLPGRIDEDENFPGTLVGEISGLLAENAPGYFRAIFQAVPNEVSFIPNWEEKLQKIADRTVDMDIRLLVMAPTWALVLFDKLIDTYNRRHGASVSTVGEVWPNLQLFIAGGVALRSYRDLLDAQIGIDIDYLETYGASEGFFSFQNELDDPSMLLHLDNGVFYEFVPAEEQYTDNPTRLTIEDVEPGVRYALYITSCSGLWSYDVGDVIRFTSVDPYKILVAGRTSEMLDKYGEAVFGDEARAALKHACEQTGAHVSHYHVTSRTVEDGDLPGHQWLVEFETAPSDITVFEEHLDIHLQDVNRHYQIRREAKAFAGPSVDVLPEGAFYQWLKATKDNISGQTKVPRMSEERTVAEEILDVLGMKR